MAYHPVRTVVYFKNYYLDFFRMQSPEVKEKLNWTMGLIETLERIPVKFFKHIEGCSGLYEIRAEVGTDIFRVFAFFDEGRVVVAMNGFQKKKQKTPRNEIALALKIRAEYYHEKEQ
jgi:phage-related protein